MRRGDRVLHVGCGTGYYTAVLATALAPGEVIGVELGAALASQARANLGDVNHATVIDGNGLEYDSGRLTQCAARRARIRSMGYGVPSDFELNFGKHLSALGLARTMMPRIRQPD